MANGPTIQSEATQLLGQIPFGAIIGAPLMAAVTAQASAAQACVDFIKTVGLDKDGNVRAATFQFNKSIPPPDDAETKARALLNPVPDAGAVLSPDQQKQLPDALRKVCSVATRIDVPILSLMPIPFIRIDNMTIAMKTTVNATTEANTSTSDSNVLEGKIDGSLGWGPVKVGFSGGISSKKDSTATSTSKYSVEHTIDVNIHAVQDDMPAGLAKILNILSDNIRALSQA